MTPLSEITSRQVKEFILLRQHLLPPRTNEDVGSVLRDLGCIQIDPVNVVERNHHLVLWNRIAGYATRDLENLAYRDRSAFEYRCNGASFLPIEEYPYVRSWMDRRARTGFVDSVQLKEPLKDLIAKTHRRIERDGPLSSRDFTSSEKVSWGYGVQTKTVNLALDYLFFSGKIAVHHREGNTKFYDVSERVVPKELLTESVSPEESVKHLAMNALRAMGVASFHQWRDRLANWGYHLHIPFLSPRSSAGEYLQSLLTSETVRLVEFEGAKEPYYVHSENVDELAGVPEEEGELRAAILPPLDNLLWDRERIKELFGFSYKWEIYMKAEKRRYGYYAMPILVGDELIGRIDPRLDRDSGILNINLLQLEPGIDLGDIESYVVDCLREFAGFHGAQDIIIEETEPPKLAPTLAQEL